MTGPDAATTRAFVSPSGRHWTAAIEFVPALGGLARTPVLRFTSRDLVLDLEAWPADWQALPDAVLVELARGAQPPRLGLPRTTSAAVPATAPPTPRA